MSLTQALSTSVAGLRTTQAGLALIASNIANAETPGYVRKTLTQNATVAAGASVSVRIDGVNRELDQFLQRQLRVETSGGSYADLRAQFYSRLQSIYGTPGSDSALETLFNNFSSAVQALTTSPESTSTRTAVLAAAQVLTQQLNGMTSDVQSLRSDAEHGLSNAVANANNALRQIAAINRQLATSTNNDATAASLKDQRDAYIDQLSKLMDIKIVQGDHDQVTVFTNSGIQLIGTEASQLAFDAQGLITPNAQWDADPLKRAVGTLTLVSPTGGAIDLIASKAIRSGEIAAYIEMRDDVLVGAQNQLDAFAAAMAQTLSDRTTSGAPAVVGAQTGFDIDIAGLLPGNAIHLNYADTPSGTRHSITIIRVDDPAVLPLSNTATDDPNDEVIGVDFSGGLASVLAQLTGRFNARVQFSNPSGTTVRILDDGAANTTNVDSVTTTKTVTSLAGGSGELPIFVDAFSPYTGALNTAGGQITGFAGRIAVNASLIGDPSKLVMYQTGVAAGDPTRPNFIYDRLVDAALTYPPSTGIGNDKTPYSGALKDFLRQMLTHQGESASNAANLAEGQNVVVNALSERMTDASGVNIDEEMSNLLKLQTAYGANARVMTTVKEMLDILMRI